MREAGQKANLPARSTESGASERTTNGTSEHTTGDTSQHAAAHGSERAANGFVDRATSDKDNTTDRPAGAAESGKGDNAAAAANSAGNDAVGATADFHDSTQDAERLVKENVRPLDGLADLKKLFQPLLPSMLGLMLARTGLIVGSYGSYARTDEGLFTDGSMLATLAIMLLGWAFIVRAKSYVGKRRVNALTHLSVIGEALSLFTLTACSTIAPDGVPCRFAASCLLTLFSSLAMICWLRRARGASNATAVVYAFVPLAASEVVLYAYSWMPAEAAYVVAGITTLAQFPCLRAARRQPRPCDLEPPAGPTGFFGMSGTILANKKYLTATAFGIGLLSFVIGLLRGYPTGESIPFTHPTRLLYALLTIGLCAWFVQRTVSGRRQIMTVFVWVVMQTLCMLALLTYSLFPEHLEFGAVFATTLNAMLVGFMWYVIIAFESTGWRDAFYYAFAGWFVCWGSRSIARVAMLSALPFQLDTLFVGTLVGCALVISVQTIFVQFIRVTNRENRELAKSFEALRQTDVLLLEQAQEKLRSIQESETATSDSRIAKLMGLDGNQSYADIRYATMEHNARELGKQFLLSDREVEVVTLYALGFTQKRVAEELYISQSTAHAHIKHIYQKTGLHSRQELLDYLEQYTS